MNKDFDLIEALRNDDELLHGYKANLTMCVLDAIRQKWGHIKDDFEVSSNAADNFFNLLLASELNQ